MPKSKWEQYKFEERIREILQDINPSHALGRPFLTGYQIAVEYALRYPEDFQRMGRMIGGGDTGSNVSLAQYIAGQLSQRLKAGLLVDLEGGFISNRHLENLSFQHEGRLIVSSLKDREYGPAIFRLKQMEPNEK